MRRTDLVQTAFARIAALKTQPDSPQLHQDLRTFLASKMNLVVAKAAKTAAEMRLSDLAPDLVAAFHRLMADPLKLDKGCAATTEIVGALYEMDCWDSSIYLKGVRHVQLEASYGKSVDAAAQLRSHSALGLVQTRHPNALFELVRLMTDPEAQARVGAIRALATVSSESASLLLQFKALIGDQDSEVLGECFSGLLAAAPERYLPFVGAYLEHEDPAISEAAALALGSSRIEKAAGLLREKWGRTARGPLRAALLLALATARQEGGLEFLLALVETESPQTAADVIAALRIYRGDERVRTRLEQTISRRGETSLLEAFQAHF